MADNTFLAPLSPIQRSTPSQNLLVFSKNEYSIYNKFTPYYQAGGDLGNDSPYIYIKLTDSNAAKNLTRYDTQAVPAGSVLRDVKRIAKFTASGRGIAFIGKQTLLQSQAIFDETRTYDVGSVIGSTGRTLPLATTERLSRHIEGGGGLINFFVGALFSTFGVKANFVNAKRPIPGTATGDLAKYVQTHGDGRYGLMRGQTASTAKANVDSIWAGAGTKSGNTGFLRKTLSALRSTTGLFSNTGRPADWVFRPEYPKGYNEGIYYKFLTDSAGFMSVRTIATSEFYNGPVQSTITTKTVRTYHKYYPDATTKTSPVDGESYDNAYASKKDIANETVGFSGNVILTKYDKMMSALETFNPDAAVQLRPSTERYREIKDINDNSYSTYADIPGSGMVKKSQQAIGPFVRNIENGEVVGKITIDKRGFAKSVQSFEDFGTVDEYNMLDVLNENEKNKMFLGPEQSKDLIFFYFYDLINKKYIPFRATLAGISDQHSPEWEDIKYMGRADKLFVYKGFSRDVSFNFRVYANSIDEMVPMWKRINYLTGLTRPSKYTAKATVTAGSNATNTTQTGIQSQPIGSADQETVSMTPFIVDTSRLRQATGLESEFIYPPMIEFRIGDLYVDQPAVLRSVNISIPDDAHWETLRGDKYEYVYGVNKFLKKEVAPNQLPTIVDVSVQLSVMEKSRSITDGYHFGPTGGWNEITPD